MCRCSFLIAHFKPEAVLSTCIPQKMYLLGKKICLESILVRLIFFVKVGANKHKVFSGQNDGEL